MNATFAESFSISLEKRKLKINLDELVETENTTNKICTGDTTSFSLDYIQI